MNPWNEQKLELLEQRGYKCENCGTEISNDYEVQHCLFHRVKGMKILDDPRNLMIVCKACHPFTNSHEVRCQFWEKQVIRYGVAKMVAWYNQVKIAGKPRFWEEDSETGIYMKGEKGTI